MPIIYRGTVVADYYADDVEIRLSALEKKEVLAPAEITVVTYEEYESENIGFEGALSMYDGMFCYNATIRDYYIGASMYSDTQTVGLTDEIRALIEKAKAILQNENVKWQGSVMAFRGEITCTLTDEGFTIKVDDFYNYEDITDGATIQVMLMPFAV